jgi:hypothetical protein
MRKIGDASYSYECALRSSLSTIKQAHDQLHLLTGMDTTATVLASQIELCDVLLVEISGIRSSLAKDLNHTRGAPRVGGQIQIRLNA